VNAFPAPFHHLRTVNQRRDDAGSLFPYKSSHSGGSCSILHSPQMWALSV
jgi:hypothetical protein